MAERTIFDPDTRQELPSLASIKYWMGYVREVVGADMENLSPPQAEEAGRCFDACLRLAEREHLRLQGGA